MAEFRARLAALLHPQADTRPIVDLTKSVSRERRRRAGSLGSITEECLGNAALVQRYGMMRQAVADYDRQNRAIMSAELTGSRVRALFLLTRPGERRAGAGTRGYLAPEQADGRALTSAADTFSLGVTLVESLSGQRPFGREAVWSSRRRIPLREGRMPRRPAGVPERLPAGLRDLLLEMVHLDPARRPSMCDVWQRLSSLSKTTTRSTATPDTGQPASSPAHAKRRR